MTQRVLIALAASFPVAIVAGFSVSLAVALDGIDSAVFWIVLAASTLFAMRELEPRRILGRTAISYALAAFSLPLTAAIFATTWTGITGASVEFSMVEMEGPIGGILTLILGAALLEAIIVMSVVIGAFGILSGLIAVILSFFLLKKRRGVTAGDTLAG